MSNNVSEGRKLIGQAQALYGLGMMMSVNYRMKDWKVLDEVNKRLKNFNPPPGVVLDKLGGSVPIWIKVRNSDQFSPFVPGLIRAGQEVGLLSYSFITASVFVGRLAELTIQGAQIDHNSLACAMDLYMLAELIYWKKNIAHSLEIVSESGSVGNQSAFEAMAKAVGQGNSLPDVWQKHGLSIRVSKDGGIFPEKFIVDALGKGVRGGVVGMAFAYFAEMALKDVLGIDAYPPGFVKFDPEK
ncbi:MAG: hypothetical protein AAB726_00045 [Patescibacteria group bacterium]